MFLTKQMVHKVLLFMLFGELRASMSFTTQPGPKQQICSSQRKLLKILRCDSRELFISETYWEIQPSIWFPAMLKRVHTVCVCVSASFWPVLTEPVGEVLPMFGTEIISMITKHPLSIIGEWQHLLELYPDMTNVLFSRREWMWCAESLSAPLLQPHRFLPLPVWPGLWAGTRRGLLPRWTCAHTHGRLLNDHLSTKTHSSVYFLCRYWWMQLLQLHVSVPMY